MTTEPTTNNYEQFARKETSKLMLGESLLDDDVIAQIASNIRNKLSDDDKELFILLAEKVLEKVIEAEVTEALASRLEAMYEAVIAEVIQKQLLQAVSKRAQDTMARIG